jgi:hypothetical protein
MYSTTNPDVTCTRDQHSFAGTTSTKATQIVSKYRANNRIAEATSYQLLVALAGCRKKRSMSRPMLSHLDHYHTTTPPTTN